MKEIVLTLRRILLRNSHGTNKISSETERSVVLKGVLFGGTANNSSIAGITCSNANNVPTNANANIGSHLGFSLGYNKQQSNGRASGQKMTVVQKRVGRETEDSLSEKQKHFLR
jgi:hypothetical protein